MATKENGTAKMAEVKNFVTYKVKVKQHVNGNIMYYSTNWKTKEKADEYANMLKKVFGENVECRLVEINKTNY